MAEPQADAVVIRQEPHLCEGCGCVGTERMRALNNRHAKDCPAKDGTLLRPVLADNLTVTDKVTGYPNEYAKRVRARLQADSAYLHLHAQHGHAAAATLVCEMFGHDARASMCNRCGSRVGRALDD